MEEQKQQTVLSFNNIHIHIHNNNNIQCGNRDEKDSQEAQGRQQTREK